MHVDFYYIVIYKFSNLYILHCVYIRDYTSLRRRQLKPEFFAFSKLMVRFLPEARKLAACVVFFSDEREKIKGSFLFGRATWTADAITRITESNAGLYSSCCCRCIPLDFFPERRGGKRSFRKVTFDRHENALGKI